MSEELWNRTKQEFPLGRVVSGTVADVFVWGFTVRLHWGAREVTEAIVEVISYRPNGEVVQSEQFPPPGATVEGKVVDHVEHNRHIKLFVGTKDPLSDVEGLGSDSSE